VIRDRAKVQFQDVLYLIGAGAILDTALMARVPLARERVAAVGAATAPKDQVEVRLGLGSGKPSSTRNRPAYS
jgi:hypothetical protein